MVPSTQEINMQYFGGKSKLADQISGYLNGVIQPGQSYYEPFCGSLNVSCRIHASRIHISDSHYELIQMWLQAFRHGVDSFPNTVSEGQYIDARDNPLTPGYLKGFIGFGCSFGGKYFGGYARDSRNGGVNFATVAKRAILKKVDHMMINFSDQPDDATLRISCAPYSDILPVPNSVIYCDPPYKGKTGYKGAGEFDYDDFLRVARGWANDGHTVLISGYLSCVPEGAVVVWSQESKQCVRSSDGTQQGTIEVLYTFP